MKTAPLLLAGSIAALLAGPSAQAQTTVTYTNGQTRATAINTSAPNDPTTLTIASGSATQSGVVSGSGEVIKTGVGTLRLSATNSYTGATTVNGGVLNIQTNAIAVVNSSSGFSINNGSILRVSGNRMDFIGKTFTFDSTGGGTLDPVATGFGGFVFKGNNTFKTNGGARDLITGVGPWAGQGFNLDTGLLAIFDTATGSDPSSDLTVSAVIWNAGGISKTGTGRLTLTGANTYTGDTTLNLGTLSLTQPYLADASSVYLAGGTDLDLNTGGAIDTIGAFYIDGVAQAAGLWGALGSGATNETSLITGSGELLVTPVPEPTSTALLLGSGAMLLLRRRA